MAMKPTRKVLITLLAVLMYAVDVTGSNQMDEQIFTTGVGLSVVGRIAYIVSDTTEYRCLLHCLKTQVSSMTSFNMSSTKTFIYQRAGDDLSV